MPCPEGETKNEKIKLSRQIKKTESFSRLGLKFVFVLLVVCPFYEDERPILYLM